MFAQLCCFYCSHSPNILNVFALSARIRRHHTDILIRVLRATHDSDEMLYTTATITNQITERALLDKLNEHTHTLTHNIHKNLPKYMRANERTRNKTQFTRALVNCVHRRRRRRGVTSTGNERPRLTVVCTGRRDLSARNHRMQRVAMLAYITYNICIYSIVTSCMYIALACF